MNEFKPGLEGIVAVQTEIAEPDREGGSLRYRGVDVEELVGHVPYENVWGLLVDDDINSAMPDPEPYEPPALTGNAPADLQTETARLSGVWKLGKLNEISDDQAREDLGRLSAQMMSIVARSARVADGHTDPVPDEVVARGETAAEELGSPYVECAKELEEVALKALQEKYPNRVIATNVEYYSAIVLDVAEIPPPLAPAMFACSRVAGWSAHILEQKRTGRLFRPSAVYVGPSERSLSSV